MTVHSALADQELMALLKQGDEYAFRDLYSRYWTVLLNAAYKRLDSIDLAEELVQDIFVSLYVKRESLIIKTTLEGYLKNALKYKIFDVFRAQEVLGKYVSDVRHTYSEQSVTPEHTLQMKELKAKLDRATDKMPEKCRKVFIMSRVENLSNKSIADQLGISVSTVEKHISKAMQILKVEFKAYHPGIVMLVIQLFMK
ncbi:putative RNA polymerase sigma factor FecI [compost metagenome]